MFPIWMRSPSLRNRLSSQRAVDEDPASLGKVLRRWRSPWRDRHGLGRRQRPIGSGTVASAEHPSTEDSAVMTAPHRVRFSRWVAQEERQCPNSPQPAIPEEKTNCLKMALKVSRPGPSRETSRLDHLPFSERKAAEKLPDPGSAAVGGGKAPSALSTSAARATESPPWPRDRRGGKPRRGTTGKVRRSARDPAPGPRRPRGGITEVPSTELADTMASAPLRWSSS